MQNIDCNKAIKRIIPKIDFNKIKNIFDELPNSYNGLVILSEAQRRFYLEAVRYRYKKILLPTYEKLIVIDKNV